MENVEGTVTKSKPDPGFAQSKDSDVLEQASEKSFDFGGFVDDNVYPMVTSMLDNSQFSRNQAKISKGYREVVQGYA